MEKLSGLVARFARTLNRKPYLRFFASVRLAIPLLLTLGGVVAAGTIIESRYNTDYARLLVYDAWWFRALLALLWINIFLSTVSRYPYQSRHTGFVIVHVGLLTLLIGGFITRAYGTDGQLRVAESAQSATVMLGDLSMELIDVQTDSAIRVPFTRSASHLAGSELNDLNERFNSKILVREYMPFAEVREGFSEADQNAAGPIAVGFMMKSQFFDVSEWLHSSERPEMHMGPATLRLVVTDGEPAVQKVVSVAKSKKKKGPVAASGAKLVVHDEKTGEILKQIPVTGLRAGLKLSESAILNSIHVYQHAVVVDNKLREGDNPGANPALEMEIKSMGKVVREVAYAKYPDFSLSQMRGEKSALGLKFEYQAGGESAPSMEMPDDEAHAAVMAPGSRSGNVIEFHVSRRNHDDIRVELYKNNERVMTQPIKPGESVTTPWMGIRLTLGAVKWGATSKTEVAVAALQPRSELPPSAVYVTPAGVSADQGFWLAEGQFKRVSIMGREYEVYFGHHAIELPFSLKLTEFKKVDYPGTETPMSFESEVRVNGQGSDVKISMNEPLKLDGYTIYQSSYDVRPGQPRASIFSVNRDPGRPMKYFGSLILALGIITFTLQRSRMAKRSAS